MNDGALRYRLVRRETSVSNSQPESQPVTDSGRLLLGAYLSHLLVPLVLVVDALRIALATAWRAWSGPMTIRFEAGAAQVVSRNSRCPASYHGCILPVHPKVKAEIQAKGKESFSAALVSYALVSQLSRTRRSSLPPAFCPLRSDECGLDQSSCCPDMGIGQGKVSRGSP